MSSKSVLRDLGGSDTSPTAALRESDQLSDQDTRQLLCDFLRLFYARGWVSGTGGGICGPTGDGKLLLAPTGVHKERVRPDDFFVVSVADGRVLEEPQVPGLLPSECNAIFCLTARARQARSVAHSHALSAVIAGDLVGNDDHLAIRDLEMLKGIREVSNRDLHLVPVVRNTPREPELVAQIEAVLAEERFAGTFAVIVRDHGAYIWGADIWEAKRHTEVYHFLFEAVAARRRL
jgi:methylthioribulose-1-phosphate dehydratase